MTSLGTNWLTKSWKIGIIWQKVDIWGLRVPQSVGLRLICVVCVFYFEEKAETEVTLWISSVLTVGHIFLTSGNEESPLFFRVNFVPESFFFPLFFFLAEEPSRALTMREKATVFSACSFSTHVQFLLLLDDVVLTYFRCFSTHFRYAKSNLLVCRRRAAVGAHPR